MDFKTIKYEVKENVATITLNRPNELNALSNPMILETIYAMEEIIADDSIRAVIITGEGKAFSSGGDINEIKDSYGGTIGFQRHMEIITKMMTMLAELPKPVIAAVNGVAVGAGMNIALAADFVIASKKAKFSEIFSNIGFVPDLGGTYFLPRLVGRQRAKEIVFSSRMILADEALELGIVLEVVEPENLIETVNAIAQKYSKGPTAAYALAKKIINKSFESNINTILDYEGFAQSICGFSEDHKEGLNAMFEKRKADFIGK